MNLRNQADLTRYHPNFPAQKLKPDKISRICLTRFWGCDTISHTIN
jgi:hypothetical protein